jgi:hypothetical protein
MPKAKNFVLILTEEIMPKTKAINNFLIDHQKAIGVIPTNEKHVSRIFRKYIKKYFKEFEITSVRAIVIDTRKDTFIKSITHISLDHDSDYKVHIVINEETAGSLSYSHDDGYLYASDLTAHEHIAWKEQAQKYQDDISKNKTKRT